MQEKRKTAEGRSHGYQTERTANILLYSADKIKNIVFDLSEILMPDESYDLFEIWSGKTLEKVRNRFKSTVDPHGAVLYKITCTDKC